MAAPISKGRMLRKDVSRSKKISSLSMMSRVLFFMIIPHLNACGKLNGSPYFIKGEVVPLIDEFDVCAIGTCLKEISDKTNLKWFERGGLWYLHSINWNEHQELRGDRIGNDDMPDWTGKAPAVFSTPERVRDYSGTTPEQVRLEVEEEVEEEVEVELEGKPEVEAEGETLSAPSEGGAHGDESPSSPPHCDLANEISVEAEKPVALVELWNKYASQSNLIKAIGMSKSRKAKCRNRLRSRPLAEWDRIFAKCGLTPFLNGDNQRGWRAAFDWIIHEENACKVLEGFYEQYNPGNNHPDGGGAPRPKGVSDPRLKGDSALRPKGGGNGNAGYNENGWNRTMRFRQANESQNAATGGTKTTGGSEGGAWRGPIENIAIEVV